MPIPSRRQFLTNVAFAGYVDVRRYSALDDAIAVECDIARAPTAAQAGRA